MLVLPSLPGIPNRNSKHPIKYFYLITLSLKSLIPTPSERRDFKML